MATNHTSFIISIDTSNNFGYTHVGRKLFGQFSDRRHTVVHVVCRFCDRILGEAASALPSVRPRAHPNQFVLAAANAKGRQRVATGRRLRGDRRGVLKCAVSSPPVTFEFVFADLYYQFGHLGLTHNTHRGHVFTHHYNIINSIIGICYGVKAEKLACYNILCD